MNGGRTSVADGALGCVVVNYGNWLAGGHMTLTDLLTAGVPPQSIVVVNNPGGADGDTCAPPPEVRVICPSDNLGFGAAINIGVRAHEQAAALLLVLTAGTRLAEGSVDQLVRAAQLAPQFGVLGPVIVSPGNRRVRSYGGVQRPLGSVWHRRRASGIWHRRAQQRPPDRVIEADWVDGCAMLIPRRVWDQAGPIEERFFMYFEEPDFCWRAHAHGWRVGVVSGALAWHDPGAIQRRRAYRYLMARNGLELGYRVAGRPGVAIALVRQLALVAALTLSIPAKPGHSADRVAEVAAVALGCCHFATATWGPPPSWTWIRGDIVA